MASWSQRWERSGCEVEQVGTEIIAWKLKKKSVRNEKYIKKYAFHRYSWNSYILDSKQWENADLPVDYRNGNTLLEAREQNQNTIKWLAVPAGGNRRVQAPEDRLASPEGWVITKWEADWRDVALGQTGFTWWGVLVEEPLQLGQLTILFCRKGIPSAPLLTV